MAKRFEIKTDSDRKSAISIAQEFLKSQMWLSFLLPMVEDNLEIHLQELKTTDFSDLKKVAIVQFQIDVLEGLKSMPQNLIEQLTTSKPDKKEELNLDPFWSPKSRRPNPLTAEDENL